jgi:hypothetical protein
VAACAQVTRSSSYPDVAEWTDYFRHARATDAGALAVMAPRDGPPLASDRQLMSNSLPSGSRMAAA